MSKQLPKDFVMGGATAAYQVEGATKEDGKGQVLWDPFLKKQGRFSPDPAADFYHRYDEDLALAEQYGHQVIRISIAWSRIFPDGAGAVESRGVAYYHRLFAACAKHHIVPFVTLHHFDTPERLHEAGDWLSQEMLDDFVDYAKFCFKEFPEIKHWITINEPTSMAVQQYTSGTFPPAEKGRFDKTFQAEHNQMVAHARIVNLFKSMKIDGEIGIVHALQTVYPYSDTKEDQHAADLQDALDNRLYLDGTLAGEYAPQTLALVREILDANHQPMFHSTPEEMQTIKKAAQQLDFVGVNNYFSKWLRVYHGKSETIHNGTGAKGSSVSRLHGIGEEKKPESVETTDWDWPIYPRGMYDILMRIHNDYPLVPAIYVTENGIGLKESLPSEVTSKTVIADPKRIDYLKKYLGAIADAIDDGANVRGYFVWSLQDQFSWTNGYSKRYGLFFVDFETQKRYIKQSAEWFKKVCERHVIPD
ncbi:6-phospho-beta-galactosidase [Lacticaseibacillus chiayiensis]|uniref:6-phospho-beta-galactosidase n=1 Tax=Lacticaseibacillus chiayiensis TaxID=2100821 RepID=A0ABY6H9H9_9LACO|nr:6-phospho-beta-galactosidase [Lacticaseibacillus chiayiensis]QVI35249.1 6-phospho-beta-galactosidase [Lacticaseibacillus chiayiensis]UYN57030.1 6-phospho-beta-galactosidase [Lacticaseibacillus chiayiensis]